VTIKEGVADLIDDIFGCGINGVSELTLEEVEVAVDCLLEHAALGLDVALQGVLLDQ
jgi:hypothetical protein